MITTDARRRTGPLPVLAAGLFALAGCADSHGAPPTPAPVAGDEVLTALGPELAALPDEARRYAAATVEIACLAAREPDPRAVARGTREIYARHGFTDPMRYLALVRSLETDGAVRAALEHGERLCLRE